MRLIADVWVPGIPVTKGSVNVNRGGTGVRQAARGYAAWSNAVRTTLRTTTVQPAVRRDEGAMIRCRFWVPRPAGAEAHGGLWFPGARDGDKLERAVWDAVTAAGLWSDDAQVIEWAGSRRWADGHRAPGVHITIHAVTLAEVGADVGPLRDSAGAYRRAMYPDNGMGVQRW